MKSIFSETMRREIDVIALLLTLKNEGRLYHCEDNAFDIGIFTETEAAALNERMKEAYSLDWDSCLFECPCDIALSLDQEKEKLTVEQRDLLVNVETDIFIQDEIDKEQPQNKLHRVGPFWESIQKILNNYHADNIESMTKHHAIIIATAFNPYDRDLLTAQEFFCFERACEICEIELK